MTTPYVPYTGNAIGSPLRGLYRSVVQVQRVQSTINDMGGMSMDYVALDTVVDPLLDQPGLLLCRLDLTFVRPGKDQPAPIVAGRAPDRIGVCYYDPASDENGVPLVLAGDRLVCQTGPINGTFEIRVVPDVAQDSVGAHHIEVQVIEVSQALQPGSVTPFPGSAP